MKDGMGGILNTHERNQKRIYYFNPLNAELNPICYLLALLGAYHILHGSGSRVKASEVYNFTNKSYKFYVFRKEDTYLSKGVILK
jgi:hypothetical protein